MKVFPAILFVSCMAVAVNAQFPKCHMIELEQCFDKLHQLKDGDQDPSYLLTNEDGLNKICRVLKVDLVDCILGYINKCATPLYKELTKTISQAILEHMDGICSPNSPFRENILKHGTCLHENVLGTKDFQRTCNNPLFTKISWGEEHAHAEHPERSPFDILIDSGCCAYRQWEDCAYPVLSKECTEEGKTVLYETVSKLLGGLPDYICSRKFFSDNSKFCTSLPSLEEQQSQTNITNSESLKFSIFSLLKMLLKRDS